MIVAAEQVFARRGRSVSENFSGKRWDGGFWIQKCAQKCPCVRGILGAFWRRLVAIRVTLERLTIGLHTDMINSSVQ
jgi:hypothetical protein